MPADDDLSRVYTLIRAVGLTMLAGCFTEAAQPSWQLSVQTYSFHEHTDEIYLHNTTPGAGLIRRDEDWLLGAGVFRNSVGRWAGYAYTGWQPVFKRGHGRIPDKSSSVGTNPVALLERNLSGFRP